MSTTSQYNDGREDSPFNGQNGIDATSDGDTVLVQTGTYQENINYNGKSITVGSMTLTSGDTSYVSQTIINAEESVHAVELSVEKIQQQTSPVLRSEIQKDME